MAQTVYQLTGDALDDIHFNSNYYYLGISIEQKEFMKYPPAEPFSFILNGEMIQMGRTYMYEPGVPLYAPTNLKKVMKVLLYRWQNQEANNE